MGIFEERKLKLIKEKINNKSKIKRYIEFSFGCLLVAISFNLFLSPNNLVPGGVSGISVIFDYLFGINEVIIISILSVICLILSYLLLEKEKTKMSILGTILFPIFVGITEPITNIVMVDTNQLLLSTIFGGVLHGIGTGIIFRAGFTTGGTDIVNQIMSKYMKMSIGKSMIICDGTIALSSIFFFGPTKMLYSIIVLYLISYISDRVILGISDSKAFYIITDYETEIKEYIIKYLNHGVTVFNAKGGFKKDKKNVLLCVLPTKEYYILKEGIHEIDPEAFFVVTDAYEVFGGE